MTSLILGSSETRTGDDFKRSRKRKNRQYDEIHTPGYHTTHIAWDGYSEWEDLPKGTGLTDVPVKVRKLCHITHDQECGEIRNPAQKCYVFKPKSKYGKSGYGNYDGTPVGNSYKMYEPTEDMPNINTEYQHVSSKRKMFPGYYSWWSIDGTNTFEKAKNYTPSNVFIYPAQSYYGNRKFTSDILPLLKAYQKALAKRKQILPKIVFRNGGTLRYRHEICNVVITCTEESDLNEDLYPEMWKNIKRAYHYRNGEIYHIDPITDVKIKNGIKNVPSHKKTMATSRRKKFQYYSWDTYAFAFYFPSKRHQLICPWNDITESSVQHPYCTKSQPINGDKSYRYVCPNKLPPVIRKEDTVESEDEEKENGETINMKCYNKHKKQKMHSGLSLKN